MKTAYVITNQRKDAKFYLSLIVFPSWVTGNPNELMIKKYCEKKEAEMAAKKYGGIVEQVELEVKS